MGPEYPSSCLDYFAPNTTKFATVEFTPNMGAIGPELDRSAMYLESMLIRLQQRRVHVVVIDLVPRPPGCQVCVETFEAAHARVERAARRTHTPLVTVHYNESTWSDDWKHLNAKGHWLVAEQVMAAFKRSSAEVESSGSFWSLLKARTRGHRWHTLGGSGGGGQRSSGGGGQRSSADGTLVSSGDVSSADGDELGIPQCVFGSDLTRLTLPGSRGFELLQSGKHRDKPGLLATAPDAALRLCLRGLPQSFGLSIAFERSDVLPMSNVSLACEQGCLCPQERLSNGDWTLLFSGMGNRRATESYMHRVFGSHRPLSGAALAGGGTGTGRGCDCVVTLTNTQDPRDTRVRVKVNGLVAGASSRISWANRFHMGLNPNVITG